MLANAAINLRKEKSSLHTERKQEPRSLKINLERLSDQHPKLSILCSFLVVPLTLLLGVTACTGALVIPMAWLMGWL